MNEKEQKCMEQMEHQQDLLRSNVSFESLFLYLRVKSF